MAAPSSRFQSTPPAEARGDALTMAAQARQKCFNPLPPPKRGETVLDQLLPAGLGVSIHSPRRSEGRPELDLHPNRRIEVSIHSPRRSEGRPRAMRGHVQAVPSFNPLPPPKRGETARRRRPARVRIVSIHSPRRSEGRPHCLPQTIHALHVSIHSPRRSEGRPPKWKQKRPR